MGGLKILGLVIVSILLQSCDTPNEDEESKCRKLSPIDHILLRRGLTIKDFSKTYDYIKKVDVEYEPTEPYIARQRLVSRTLNDTMPVLFYAHNESVNTVCYLINSSVSIDSVIGLFHFNVDSAVLSKHSAYLFEDSCGIHYTFKLVKFSNSALSLQCNLQSNDMFTEVTIEIPTEDMY